MPLKKRRSYGPSLKCPDGINPDADAQLLSKACKGLGTDEDVINKLIGHRSYKQRIQIKDAYERRHKKDLIETLASETKGNYESLLKTLFRNPMQILAHDLYKGMKGLGTNTHVLNEIICCCTNSEIQLLKRAYKDEAASRSLEIDVNKETKGPYERLLIILLKADRKEDQPSSIEEAMRSRNISRLINQNQVDMDVNELHEASEKRSKIDPDPFIHIITSRSKYHIKAIWDLYKEKYNTTLVDVISKSFSEPLRSGLNTTVMAQVNLRLLICCQLYESIYGLGTREDTLIRIICLKCESDMNNMNTVYQQYFGKNIIQAIRDDTSGDFRKLLIILLGE